MFESRISAGSTEKFPGTAESVRTTWSTRFVRKAFASTLFMKEAARQDSTTARNHLNSLAYFRAIQGHSGGISIDPELMVYIRIPYNWKENIFFRGVVLSAFATKDGRLSSSHHFSLLVEIPTKKNPYTVPSESALPQFLET